MKQLIAVLLFLTVLWGEEGYVNKVPVPHTLVFAIGEWKPFIGEELEGYGPAVKLVDSLCKEAGFECYYEFMPWKRAWLSAQSGQVDGTFAWMLTDMRKNEMHHIGKPLFNVPKAVFYRKEAFSKAPEIQSLEDFVGKGYRIVDVRGYYSAQELTRMGENVHIVNNEVSRWKMIARGAMDITTMEAAGHVEGRKYIKNFDREIGTIILPNTKNYYIFYSRIADKYRKLPEKMRWLEKVMNKTEFHIEGIDDL